MSNDSITLLKVYLEIDSIIIGERFKGGVFRPCQETIPSSTIEGALKHYFDIEVPAVGFFLKNTYKLSELTYSIRDRFFNTSKLPITTFCLVPKDGAYGKIEAKVYIPSKKGTNLKDKLEGAEFRMGALKSKGFGKTKVVKVEEIESKIKQGILKVKLFEDETKDFGIKPISPLYGYLFKPDNFSIGGKYKRALFPGSLVIGPKVFLKEETYYDERKK